MTDWKAKFTKLREDIMKEIAEQATIYAQRHFAEVDYDGEYNVQVSSQTIHDFFPGKSEAQIMAVGTNSNYPDVNTALFVEFGTGVRFAEPVHPEAEENGMYRGGFGQHQGMNESGWTFEGVDGETEHTFGNPANMCMYNAREDIRKEVNNIVERAWDSI